MTQAKLSPNALAQLAVVTEGALRVGPLVALPALIQELGQEPDPVIRESGVDPRHLDDPENSIGFTALGRLLAHCAERTGCAHLGLLLGQRSGLQSLGLIGALAEHSPEVGTALRNLILHLHLHDRGAVPVLSVEGKRAFLGYSIYQPGVEGTRQIYDGSIAIICNIMRTLCGSDWRPAEVIFSHGRPADPRPFRAFFQAPLRFDGECTGVVFSAHSLDQRLRGADPQLRRLLEERIAALESNGAGDLVVQVRRVLHNLLLDGRGSLGQVAGVFEVHRRTLNRRMRELGLTVRQLIDEERYQIARQLLGETDLSVVELAAVLGYADASAFSRAFRRWSGTSPTAWRMAQRCR